MGPLSCPLLICLALAFSQASSQATQCKERFQEFEGSCYLLSDTEDSWHGAKQKCLSLGGNLVSIQTEKENAFVRNVSANNTVWIGGRRGITILRNRFQQPIWKWISGQGMPYTNWDQGQPREFPQKYAMMMFADGTWGNEYATQPFKFICEEDPVPACDEGYQLLGPNCYMYREEKLGFREAKKNCSDDGGDLASVHGNAEDGFLRSLVGNGDYAWIGGYRDPEKTNDWQWTDGTAFDFQRWSSGQPAENPNNNCIVMNYPDFGKRYPGWSNELCNFAYGYICEKPQKKP